MLRKLREALKKDELTKASFQVEKIYPVDLAEFLVGIPSDKQDDLLEIISDEKLARIIENLAPEVKYKVLIKLDKERLKLILEYMSTDEIVDLLGNLPVGKSKELLALLRREYADLVKSFLGYAEETAGSLMTTEYIALKKNLTVKEAIRTIRKVSGQQEVIKYIYIVNDAKELVGYALLREILASQNDLTLDELYYPNVISTQARVDQEDVAMLIAKYDLTAIPVTTDHQQLIGVITVDDIIDVIEAENTEDMYKLAGINKVEKPLGSILTSMKERVPWLFINLGAAFLAAAVISQFEGIISKVVALTSFLPIVASLGGNSGNQALTIMVRNIALNEIDLETAKDVVIREVALGLINGAILGLVTASIAFIWKGNMTLGMIVGVTTVFNMMVANLLGVLIPLTLKYLKVDPALASSIFLTTLTDILGFFFLLGLATMLLNYLL
ncbi:magnesium transporter [Selenihalanaerobacter shriftii]|uniref:Magnesium transporter MgtE n=1 Tax=Selenihalanaerobacter shriftii TaxID=142842 RepID=A0A1T4JMJ6_9FIRM|nr:magnesium transporter [Selenihalanaerobacter shriftii]SJZ31235.1 magnesium transporter [Selenihalanaerobacter shriftii]